MNAKTIRKPRHFARIPAPLRYEAVNGERLISADVRFWFAKNRSNHIKNMALGAKTPCPSPPQSQGRLVL